AGVRAREFPLPTGPTSQASLEEYRGRPVVLVFYPADWSPGWSYQLGLYNELGGEFARFNAALLPISVDGVWSHAAFVGQRHYHFPLLSDFEPKGRVSRSYGVYNETAGTSQRALFVI